MVLVRDDNRMVMCVLVVLSGGLCAEACSDDDSRFTGTGGSAADAGSSTGGDAVGGNGTSAGGAPAGAGGSVGGAGAATGGNGNAGGGATGGTGGATGGMGGVGGAAGGMGGAGGGMGGVGGAGGQAPICEGTETACDTFTTDVTCSVQSGCFVNGTCAEIGGAGGAGGNMGCAAYTESTTCEAQGCAWLMPCQPTVACDGGSFPNATVCNLQTGCEWDVNNGTCIIKQVNGCVDSLVEADCTVLVGCTWDDTVFTCGGTAQACATFDVASCSDQDGCAVQ